MLVISNWDRWQTFRKDRGTPPWIKLHRCIMTNPEWVLLSDAEKGQLISLWIVGADKNGVLATDDATVLQKIALLDSKPNIPKFIELGFMSTTCQPHVNHMVTTCPQLDAPEERREEESRGEENGIPYGEIIQLLNEKTGKSFKASSKKTRSQIDARFNEGFTQDDFIKVIEIKSESWLTDSKMVIFLRPETLFGTKFEGYLNENPALEAGGWE